MPPGYRSSPGSWPAGSETWPVKKIRWVASIEPPFPHSPTDSLTLRKSRHRGPVEIKTYFYDSFENLSPVKSVR